MGLKTMAYGDPGTLDALLSKLADAVAGTLLNQVRAGADLIQIFDTWAGRLPPDDYERWALPATRSVVDRVRGTGVPVILYVNGAAGLVELMARTGADVLSVDSRLRMDEARRRVGPGLALQGNLDPVRLFGPMDGIRDEVRSIAARAGGRGHVLNLGHGVLPGTPVDAVKAFVDAAREVAR